MAGTPVRGKLRGEREAIVGDDLVQLALLGGFPRRSAVRANGGGRIGRGPT
ncbi:hypothetical protein MAXJ12_23852 [Mesorhizobium alhagi CCNWXJ12-2]|uniref:Uncharacterized protein n=1 Tax=Mesorhizobium alhagi CCNWXJ12-2 TaxID=1107882 RepID=H0HX51_9HYPH|nr:hypothetical protein MAXJ12_23852 [Mesorhizobium alhagi CCNWXJ12-2]